MGWAAVCPRLEAGAGRVLLHPRAAVAAVGGWLSSKGHNCKTALCSLLEPGRPGNRLLLQLARVGRGALRPRGHVHLELHRLMEGDALGRGVVREGEQLQGVRAAALQRRRRPQLLRAEVFCAALVLDPF